MLAKTGNLFCEGQPGSAGICFLRFVSYRRAKRDSTASRYVHWQFFRLCQVTVDFRVVRGKQGVYIALVLSRSRMLMDRDQLPLFQLADPVLYSTHSNAQLAAHLLQTGPALSTVSRTADQVGIDLEGVHIQRHIEDVMLYNILL